MRFLAVERDTNLVDLEFGENVACFLSGHKGITPPNFS